MRMREIFLENYRQYPLMLLGDMVKLAYQSEFGCGHLVDDAQSSLAMLREEWENVLPDGNAPIFEPIGNDYARLNLSAGKAEKVSLEAINRLFVASAQAQSGTAEGFVDKLEVLRELIGEGALPYDARELSDMADDLAARDYPPARHTPAYRETYAPAYRVVRRDLAKALPVISLIEARFDENHILTLAIDGRCASGKTTLADALSRIYRAPVIHMDDFFLPATLRDWQRLSEPGGNVHYERFLSEVAPNLHSGKPFRYRKFDCSAMDFGKTVEIAPAPLMIVEGSYSLRPDLRGLYDLKVFSDVSPEEQCRRIRNRDGEEMVERFRSRWIPMEERYFEAFSVRAHCDLVICPIR